METEIDKIKKIKDKHVTRLMKKKGVQIVSIGFKEKNGKITDELSVRVGVVKKAKLNKIAKKDLVPAKVGGIISDVFECGEILAQALPRKQVWRPAFPGVSIGHYAISAGTLGCLVKDRVTNETLILSNNHVLAASNDGKVGDKIYQPGDHDGGLPKDTIGTLLRFKEILFGSGDRNLIDAALCKPSDPSIVIPRIAELDIPSGIKEAIIGMQVIKSGRTTQVTMGFITDLHATISVRYGPNKTAIFEDQILSTNMSAGGDSGSLMMEQGSLAAIGLLYAGGSCVTVYNKIGEVLDEMGVDLIIEEEEEPEPEPSAWSKLVKAILTFFQSLFDLIRGK